MDKHFDEVLEERGLYNLPPMQRKYIFVNDEIRRLKRKMSDLEWEGKYEKRDACKGWLQYMLHLKKYGQLRLCVGWEKAKELTDG